MSLANWMTALGEPQETEEFVCVHGARMRCLIAGEGPAVLLLHGLLGTADAWGPATQRLAANSHGVRTGCPRDRGIRSCSRNSTSV